MDLDTHTIAMLAGGVLAALILFKFIIRIPFLLLKYAIFAAIIYALYLIYIGKM